MNEKERSDRSTEQMPDTIGRYQVLESIGFGAMGAVYKAFDPLIKRTIAIKTIRLDIPRQSPQYKSFIERFYHEARISGTLSHPNIVTLFDIGEENGLPYLAMEFVEGETIASLIERGQRFNPEKIVALVSQIASAVDYAHTKGVIHRDIKPSNLILYEEERVKVTDFGIAKLIDAEMTQSGTLLGTPSYMSPEQAMGDKLDGRSDIFSLGVCAFEMLSGEQPFPGTNVTSILYKLVHVDPIEPPNLEMNGLVPQKWHEVFSKVLAKKPDDRYQTASEFVQDLEYCLGSWFGAAMGEELEAATALAGLAGESGDTTAAIPAVKPSTVPPASDAARPVSATLLMKSETLPPVPIDAPEGIGSAPTIQHVRPPELGKAEPTPTTEIASVPPTVMVPKTSTARSPRKGLSNGAVIGGGLALLALVAGIAMLAVWRHRHPRVLESPTPVPETTLALGASPSPAAEAAPTGSLKVESQPAGAAVSLNGTLRGVTPLSLADLPFGGYDVKIELKGYEAKTQRVTLGADARDAALALTLTRSAIPLGFADLLSQPFGAAVRIDGSSAGKTPLANFKLKPGRHTVEIVKEGFEPWSGTLNVEAGKRAFIDARLRAVARAAATPEPRAENVDVNHVYELHEVDGQPKRRSGTSATYPENQLGKLKSGQTVSVAGTFIINENGDVTDIHVTESSGKLLDDAVLAAVRTWKYAPVTKRGTKVKVRMPFRQTFRAG